MRTQQDSTICLECAGNNRLKFLPCPTHYPAMPSELCEHNRTTFTLIHNGTGVLCYDCGSHLTIETTN